MIVRQSLLDKGTLLFRQPLDVLLLLVSTSLLLTDQIVGLTGKSGIRKKQPIATTAVRVPSRIKIQRQPKYPRMPFILPIALARSPPKAPANVVEAKKKVYLF